MTQFDIMNDAVDEILAAAQHQRITEALRGELSRRGDVSVQLVGVCLERDQLRAEVERLKQELAVSCQWEALLKIPEWAAVQVLRNTISDKDSDIEQLRALLAQQQGVPNGYVLVPVEPTLEMANASVYNGTDYTGSFDFDDFKKDWTDILAAAPAPVQAEPQTAAASDVLAERQRQISAEGWTPEHDDEHGDGSMALAASCYACASAGFDDAARDWPWSDDWFKPSSPRRDLIKAGALILAEIERLDRAALPPAPEMVNPDGPK